MATMNPFDLLGDDDNDDVSQLVEKIASAPAKKTPPAAGKPAAPPAKLPSKPLPPAQAGEFLVMLFSIYEVLIYICVVDSVFQFVWYILFLSCLYCHVEFGYKMKTLCAL